MTSQIVCSIQISFGTYDDGTPCNRSIMAFTEEIDYEVLLYFVECFALELRELAHKIRYKDSMLEVFTGDKYEDELHDFFCSRQLIHKNITANKATRVAALPGLKFMPRSPVTAKIPNVFVHWHGDKHGRIRIDKSSKMNVKPGEANKKFNGLSELMRSHGYY